MFFINHKPENFFFFFSVEDSIFRRRHQFYDIPPSISRKQVVLDNSWMTYGSSGLGVLIFMIHSDPEVRGFER